MTRTVLVRPLINVERNSPFFLPLGLLCISSALRTAGHDVRIVDFEFSHRIGCGAPPVDYLREFSEQILIDAPDVVGLTALADSLPLVLLMSQDLRRLRPNLVVVVGGPGVFGRLPELCSHYNHVVDYFCHSEGEIPMLRLLEALQSGRRGSVPGMWATSEGSASCERLQLTALDDLPPPDYGALPVHQYLEIASPRIFDLYVGQGCSYSCSFCTTAPFWDHTFRAKSPSRIFSELSDLEQKYGVTQVNFLHDNFANKKDYLNDFLDYFIDRNTRYEWACALRPDNVTLDQLRRMRLAGCIRLFSGIDSGSSKVLQLMKKLPSAKKSYLFFTACRQANIQIETNTIIGYPTESDANLEESLAIVFDAIAYGAVSADVSVLQPLQGAPVTEANQPNLHYSGASDPGAFFPPEVERMVRANLPLFSSYGFIRLGNRDAPTYERLKLLVRFFSRHFFRTLFFLKNACGQRYLDIFDAMSSETDPEQYGSRFASLVQRLGEQSMLGELRAVANQVLRFDAAIEQLKQVDIAAELTNIYSKAGSTVGDRYTTISATHPVHMIFQQLPQIDVPEERRTDYLMFRSASEVVTIELTAQQREIWCQMSRATSKPAGEVSRVDEGTRALFAAILSGEAFTSAWPGSVQAEG